MPALGQDLDLRTDVPGYRVWRDGELVAEVADVTDYWRDDLVGFVLGCSYSFEEALTEDGIEIRHITLNRKVPMFETNIPTRAGRAVPRADGRLDAAVEAGGRDPRHPDHLALSRRARRAGPYRQAGG